MNTKKQVCAFVLLFVLANVFSVVNAQNSFTDSIKVVQGLYSDRSNAATLSPMKKYIRVEFEVVNLDSIQSVSISLGTSVASSKDIFIKNYLLKNTGNGYMITGDGYFSEVKANKISIMIMLEEKDYKGKIITVEAIGVESTDLFMPITKNIVLQK